MAVNVVLEALSQFFLWSPYTRRVHDVGGDYAAKE
jgi:hypothetical protein